MTTRRFFLILMAVMYTACQSNSDAPAIVPANPCVGVNCDDGNACTDDVCKDGVCVHSNNTVACDDGNVCTSEDKCGNGICVGGMIKACDDKNPCTIDECDQKTGCKYEPAKYGTPCDDGDACTEMDICHTAGCFGTYILCDDKNPCTDDKCDPTKGCLYKPASWSYIPCDDGDACTTDDLCKAGLCVGGTPKNCDDGNPCTTEKCDKYTGCNYGIPWGQPCDDKDACTTEDQCNNKGVCVGGAPLNCNDDKECTYDSCDTSKGCVHEVVPAVTACNDNIASTIDICDGDGTCKHFLADTEPKFQCKGNNVPAMYVPAEGTYRVQPTSNKTAVFEVKLEKGWVSAMSLEIIELTEPLSQQVWVVCKEWPCYTCYGTEEFSATPTSWSCGADGKGSGKMIPCPE